MCRSTINEEPLDHRCSREVPPNVKNKKTIGRTKKNTRFNEVRQIAYVLGARKREFFIDSIINYNFMHTLEEDSTPLFIAKKT